MSSQARLVAGELKRLVKYNILPVSLATAIIWEVVLFLFLSNRKHEITPLLIFVDVAACPYCCLVLHIILRSRKAQSRQ